jgi:hypothetical protein
MPLAVVVAAGVAVNDGAIEEHRQHLLHGKFGSASVDADAQLVQHVDCPLAQPAAKHIGATLFGQKPRHRAMLMFGCLQHLGIDDLSVFDIENGDLWSLSEVLLQYALIGWDGYSLIHDNRV